MNTGSSNNSVYRYLGHEHQVYCRRL